VALAVACLAHASALILLVVTVVWLVVSGRGRFAAIVVGGWALAFAPWALWVVEGYGWTSVLSAPATNSVTQVTSVGESAMRWLDVAVLVAAATVSLRRSPTWRFLGAVATCAAIVGVINPDLAAHAFGLPAAIWVIAQWLGERQSVRRSTMTQFQVANSLSPGTRRSQRIEG
jgi:hypothetical protein